MFWRDHVGVGLLLAALLGTSACCTPMVHRAHSTELPRDAVAVLLQRDHTFVMQIDDEPAPCRRECCREIWLAPGPHAIGFAFADGNSRATGLARVGFVAEPGVTYELHQAGLDSFWMILLKSFYGGSGKWVGWVVDTRTQAVVGGVTPEMWRRGEQPQRPAPLQPAKRRGPTYAMLAEARIRTGAAGASGSRGPCVNPRGRES